MRAALRDQRRREAIERTKAHLTTPEERDALWKQVQQMFRRMPPGVAPRGRNRRQQMGKVYDQMLANLEAQKEAATHKVQPVGDARLVVPQKSLILTLDEARRISARERAG